MCQECNYPKLLASAHLDITENRMRVLEVIGNNGYPLTAADIHKTLRRQSKINKVTVYRILDLLVDHHLVERLDSFGRTSYFGIAPNQYHRRHPHFFCKKCGRVDCLSPECLDVDTSQLWKTFPGQIDKVEIRVDGLCKNCMR